MKSSPVDSRAKLETRPVERPRRVPQWVWLVVLTFAMAATYLFVPEVRASANEAFAAVHSGDEARMQAWAASLGPWGPVAILCLQLLQVVMTFIPALPLMILSVLGYGPLWGFLLAWGGLLLASAFGYWIGRTFGAAVLDRYVKAQTAESMEQFLGRYGFWAIVAARLSPLLPADAVSLVGGLVRFGFWRYLAASAVGTLPVALMLAFLGADVKRMMGGLAAVSLVTLLVFAAYVLRDRRLARQG